MVEKDGNGKEERNRDLFQKAGNKKEGSWNKKKKRGSNRQAWNDVNGRLLVEEKRDKMQTMITSWAEVKGTVQDETVHEGEEFVPDGSKEEEEEVQAEAGTVR